MTLELNEMPDFIVSLFEIPTPGSRNLTDVEGVGNNFLVLLLILCNLTLLLLPSRSGIFPLLNQHGHSDMTCFGQ